MANQEYLTILKQGVEAWNQWRKEHIDIQPDLNDTDLSGVDLRRANLRRADLRRANLNGADLRRANLSGADLTGADLSGATLRRANLSKANLSEANFRIATLSGATLTGATLSKANLTGADLSGATLTEVRLFLDDLNGADLSGANLTGVQLGPSPVGSYIAAAGQPRPAGSLPAALGTPRDAPLIPSQVQFTAFYPAPATVNVWETLLVYISLVSALSDVQADATRFRDELGPLPQAAHALAQSLLARGTTLMIVPQCKGITFNPLSVSFRWLEEWHRADFRFQANRELASSLSNGEICIYAGPLLIGTLKLSLLFVQQEQLLATVRTVQQSGGTYQQMFVSYSHDDLEVVQRCRNMYRALGLTILMDQDTLRSGQVWSHALEQMIETADVFQLFWSKRAAASRYVRQEWEYALGRNKGEGFIRPVYWETPLIPPPPELAKLHFAYLPSDTFGPLPRQWAKNPIIFALPLIGGLILLLSSLSLLIHREDFALIVGIDILLVIVILLALLLGRRVR